MTSDHPAFGIDLGTTHSCIAHVDDAGRTVVVRNVFGRETTPSAVYFEAPGRVTVGAGAKNSALLFPDQVATLFKRNMGKKGFTYGFHGKRYSPEEVSALVLRELADEAGSELGVPVRDVVVTVPAYFGVAEKEATLRAGRIAGLNVLDVLPEPVAAALSHQERHRADEPRNLLVYDLGGGTFDTSVISVAGDRIKVVCTDGDLELGGVDWDDRVSHHLLDAFVRAHPQLDPSASPSFRQDVGIAAERLRQELSRTLNRAHNLRFGGEHVRVELSREHLERLTKDLLDRTIAIADRAVADARRKGVAELDEIVLVGGMTRTPVIAETLRLRFGVEVRSHEPDLAVARGAALYAHLIRPGGSAEGISRDLGISAERAETIRRRRPTGVVSRGLGVKTMDARDPLAATDPGRARSYITHLLPAGTPLPADTGKVQIQTVADNQPMVEVEVWEASPGTESEELADNVPIGSGRLRLPPATAARTTLHVTFHISESGLMTVTATDPRNGAELVFELTLGGMDEAAVAAATDSIARHSVTS